MYIYQDHATESENLQPCYPHLYEMIHLMKQALLFILSVRKTFFITRRILTENIILLFWPLTCNISRQYWAGYLLDAFQMNQNRKCERGANSMKRFSLVTVAVIMMFVMSVGISWGYEAQKTTGGLTVTLSAGSYPLVKGDNELSVKVTDGSGKAVTDAKISVRFLMPPMPGMAPMSSKIEAILKGDVYRFSANAAMEGTWKTEVTVVRPEKSPVTATFNLDAR